MPSPPAGQQPLKPIITEKNQQPDNHRTGLRTGLRDLQSLILREPCETTMARLSLSDLRVGQAQPFPSRDIR